MNTVQTTLQNSISGSLQESEIGFSTKALSEHLIDLRNLFIKLLIICVAAFSVTSYFYDTILNFILAPLSGKVLQLLSPTDSIMFSFKVLVAVSIFLALPFLVFLIVDYLVPALKPKERKFIIFVSFFGIFLSYFAVVYGYYLLIPSSLRFLTDFSPSGITVSLSATSYLDFLIFLYFALIIIAQIPILCFLLVLLGFVKPSLYYAKRKEIFLVSVVIAAFLTPTPDVLTLMLVSIPNLILIEAGVFFGRIFRKDPKLTNKISFIDKLFSGKKKQPKIKKINKTKTPLNDSKVIEIFVEPVVTRENLKEPIVTDNQVYKKAIFSNIQEVNKTNKPNKPYKSVEYTEVKTVKYSYFK
jgi:sec-independent protein translocase protein TatC